jgi:uncharacterized protein
MSGITVIKRNAAGRETWRYSGQILKKAGNAVILEALFNLDDMPFMGIQLQRADRFVELFYTDRWYNIFEIHDRDTDDLKGWYCNISQPAVFESEDVLSFIDLALDLWVTPDGNQIILDEDEFKDLNLDESTRDKTLETILELKEIFTASQNFSINPEMI